MVGESKILTVSYGTFSCTLEGFDDPFSTMRGIAEYFRDLAADDRYFGAEPPTPDAEMLHRIAEREVQRRVEARVQDDGIVLRQMEKSAPAVAAPALADDDGDDEEAAHAGFADAPVAAPETELSAEDTPYSDDTFNDDPGEGEAFFAAEPEAEVEELDEAPATFDTYADDSIAAKLQRIRAVVSKAPSFDDDPVEPQDAGFAETGFDAGLADAFAADEEPDSDDVLDENWAEEAPGTAALEIEDEGPETLETSIESHDFDSDDAEEETAETLAFAEDDVEDEEIQPDAVVEASEDDAETLAEAEPEAEEVEAASEEVAAAEDLAEVEVEEDVAELEPDVAESDKELETAAEAEVALDETDETAEEEIGLESAEDTAETEDTTDNSEDEDMIAAVAAAWDQFDTSAEPVEEEETAEDDSTTDAALAARIVQLKSAFSPSDEDDEEPTIAEAPADLHAAFDDVSEESDFDDSGDDFSEDVTDEDEIGPLTAEAEADEEDLSFESTLSAEDEAELMSALEDAETEAAPEDVNIFAEGSDEPEEADDEADELEEVATDEDEDADDTEALSARDRLAAITPEQTGDTAFDRILEETNSQLDDTESTRRRSAIAHLKAAVAATKADKLIRRSPEEEDAEEQSRYREDLAKVVRPRQVEGQKTERPRMSHPDDKPSPLVLVSELRVDSENGETAPAGIRPRRVVTREIDLDEGGDGSSDPNFAEFADSMGATELPDLMEAAAAYAAFVEGRREFSRPELMRRVASFKGGTDFTREAGLRSFGHLLREGKIRKLKRGQFTIPEATRFNPEARIAGE
jgi:hypothetical protein